MEEANKVSSAQLESTVHDFLTEQKWCLLLAGYSNFHPKDFKRYLYIGYKGFLLVFMSYMVLIAWTGAYKSRGNLVDIVQAVHMSQVALVSLSGLLSKLLREESLQRSMHIIRSGVYTYAEVPQDDREEYIKSETVEKIRSLTSMFAHLVIIVAVTNTAFVPIMQAVMLRSEDTSRKPLNPYLPQPFYMPFETRNVTGYLLAYLINVLFMTVLTSIVVSMHTIYVSCTLQLGAQIRILRQSLEKIEERAFRRMFGIHKSQNLINHQIYSSEEFQQNMIKCLRENIRHHQALIRLKYDMEKYTGLIFFSVVCLASCVLASHLISILENPPIHAVMNYVLTLFCEMIYTYHYCWYGEKLMDESRKLFVALYCSRWYRYRWRYQRQLSLVLCISREPLQLKSVAFRIAASLRTFSSILTTMYQIMNVARNASSRV